jgi:type IX secretion system PorP/SprF family membrane protein
MKKTIKKVILTTSVLFGSLMAQQDVQNSFYMFNPSLLNPAYAGSRDALSIVADYRSQWLNWEGAPKTVMFTMHSPLTIESVGLGLNVMNDQIGKSSRNAIFADFAYRIRLSKNNDRLAFGLRAGVDLINNNFGDLKVNDNTDPVIVQNSFTRTLYNAGAGLYVYGNKYYVGFTVPKFIPNTLAPSQLTAVGIQSKEVIHGYFLAGYVFKLNSLWDLKPSTTVRYTANAPLSVDLNLNAFFNKRIWFGVMYRHGAAAGANIVYHFTEHIRLGYSYDYSITNMNKYNLGTHEVLFGWDLVKKTPAMRSPRYF